MYHASLVRRRYIKMIDNDLFLLLFCCNVSGKVVGYQEECFVLFFFLSFPSLGFVLPQIVPEVLLIY